MRNPLLPPLALSLSTLPPLLLAAQIPLFNNDPSTQSHSEGYKFDSLLHLPGISPYFDAIGSGLSHAAPRDCEVTVASYLVRHAAIYANDRDYETYIEPILTKIDTTYPGGSSRNSNNKKKRRYGWTGPLAFLDKWTTPIDDPESQLEQITPGGIKASRKVAAHLLSRYPTLVPSTKRIYADNKPRTQDTAAAFASAFPQDIEIIEISRDGEFQSQIPHKACDAFSKEPGDKQLETFTLHYTKPIIARLQQFSPVELNAYDIMGLQQMCGYESAIVGHISKICDVFTDDEWMAYEYAWDMKYSFMVGHGNPLSPYLGFPWLNTTSTLMSKFHAPTHTVAGVPAGVPDPKIPDDDGQRFFITFTHREVPPFIATALGLFNSSNNAAEEFPTDRINWSRSWRMAELIPFLGHVGIEKLTCRGRDGPGGQKKEYIRVIANTAPRPIPNCQDGPGASCSFDRFTEIVGAGMEKYGDFDGICKNKKKKKHS